MANKQLTNEINHSMNENGEALVDHKPSLIQLFLLFLKIGSLSFGGFMALISVIESTIVNRRNLLKHKDMLDGISLANLLPGPMAVNVVAFVGYRIRGSLGALAATTGVILPSFILILILSYFYFSVGHTPGVKNFFNGFIPAISAIVLSVVWRMGKKVVKGVPEVILVVLASTILIGLPLEYKLISTLGIIFSYGFIGYKWFQNETEIIQPEFIAPFPKSSIVLICIPLMLLVILWFFPLPINKDSVLFLFLTFASMSLFLFGGGYVFIPIIGSTVVLDYAWLTQQEFLDGIALGQITPGPILISATFIGYKVAGFMGAFFTTIAMFAPPAMVMIFVSKMYERFRHSSGIVSAMRAIHCGIIGIILVAAVYIFKSSFPSGEITYSTLLPTLLIFFSALVALIRFNIDVIWILPVAGFLGFFMY